jgi:hypothetical protein
MSDKNQAAGEMEDLPNLNEIGAIDTSVAVREADTNDRFPIYGVKQLTEGQQFGGEYVGTVQRGVNDKKQPVYAQVFRNRKSGTKFGLWGTGVTNNYFRRVPGGAYVTVTYLGKAKEAFKPGQSIPHDFKFMLESGKELLPRDAEGAGAAASE